MNKSLLKNGAYIGCAIFLANAIWSLFGQDSESLFLNYLQTGLLFLIFAQLVKNSGNSSE